jgi:hypothetical protein
MLFYICESARGGCVCGSSGLDLMTLLARLGGDAKLFVAGLPAP